MIKSVTELYEFLELHDLKLEWTYKARRGPHIVPRGVSLYTFSTNKFIKELDYDADGDSLMEDRLYSNFSNNILKVVIDGKEKEIEFPEIDIKETSE